MCIQMVQREVTKGSVCWKVVERRPTIKFQLCGDCFCQAFPVLLSSLNAEQEQILYQHEVLATWFSVVL